MPVPVSGAVCGGEDALDLAPLAAQACPKRTGFDLELLHTSQNGPVCPAVHLGAACTRDEVEFNLGAHIPVLKHGSTTVDWF